MRSMPSIDRLGPGAARARVGRHLVAEREQARDARRDAARHHLLDGGAAEPPHLPRVGERHDARRRSCPCRRCRCRAIAPRPSRRASSSGAGPREAGVAATPRARRAPRSGGSSSSRAGARRSKRRLRELVDALRHAGDLAAEAELGHRRVRPDARASRRAAPPRRRRRRSRSGAITPRPVTTTRRLIAAPPCPESVPAADERAVVERHLGPRARSFRSARRTCGARSCARGRPAARCP